MQSPATTSTADACINLTSRRLPAPIRTPPEPRTEPRQGCGKPHANDTCTVPRFVLVSIAAGNAISAADGRQHVVHGQIRMLTEGGHRLANALLGADRTVGEPGRHHLP